ncbi:beta-propeller domain-containing protein [Nonomuraea soli]|uniref:Putative secreted protein with C-terminal beta-propeller domain n=1 Tax=Nonomuraea soli TaxID=1032476 RepID=A0A7W0CTV5_9ACTN|nr:beta-propeller domain-containing protein [Nonomuraea soli]MBA2897253.1 putative secreted protein with C-terminal beta-propeller domain [Nonomuraea soli]
MKLIRTAAAAAVLAAACAACTSSAPAASQKQRPAAVANIRLVSYSSCDDMLAGLRENAVKSVGPYGFGGGMMSYGDIAMAENSDARAAKDTGGGGNSPEHSTTNVHEAGADEPDLVKTDGNRIVTVHQGTLRIIDTASRRVTASLKLTDDQNGGYAPADLLLQGDRALVLMQNFEPMTKDRMIADYVGAMSSKYILVDLAGGQPRILSTIKPQGSHVDARMVGSTVRLVTRNQPTIVSPQARGDVSEEEMKKVNQNVVRQAPIDAWLPKIEITDASGATRTDSLKCERVSHPADYTGTSMLTVHTLDLAQGVTASGTDPIGVAADGDTVYSNGAGFYVASNPRWWFPIPWGPADAGRPRSSATPAVPTEETEVHRFDISQPGAPRYVASGKVPGRLLNQYSLSEHEGNLRVATTQATAETSSSGVYVLKADTMAKVGEVTGLGKGERIYSVRFMGPNGYVVTFKQVDPLYTLDLRDAAAPKVTGELKITGYSAYLHPAGDGRLIGLGQEASEKGRTMGTQISLFDVSDPANPNRLSQLFQKNSGSEAEWDPHAFLYWPKSGLTVIPLSSHDVGNGTSESGAMVLNVSDSAVTKVGMIKHPMIKQDQYSYEPSIQRTIVIGDSLWTLSEKGFQVNDINTLAEQAFIPLS